MKTHLSIEEETGVISIKNSKGATLSEGQSSQDATMGGAAGDKLKSEFYAKLFENIRF
jgi:hypothetical protein